MPANSPLILASASPRRSALLRQIGVAHRVLIADIDEVRRPAEGVAECVTRLARDKARAVRERSGREHSVVLGADTAVVLEDDMLGKPRHRDEALAMLARLSGREHRVLTAVAVWAESGCETLLAESFVRFRTLSTAECEQYWASGEPRDKAGGYAIQGFAAAFVSGLRGSYSGVMGLPLYETAELLARAGVPVWQECSE